ncbi:MAG: hypothetical protein DBY32_01990 [Phascolarctobacterium sp.]|nr:MAG: hypothetical protein DBY32_01990 [Phascolarctobacterium sp.]
MSKRVYISADYAENDGDREIVYELTKWGRDDLHKVDFVNTAEVTNSVSSSSDCRPCDLKQEFNQKINESSTVIFIVGDKTASRTAGNTCERFKKDQFLCSCTPYKQNTNGKKLCKVCFTYTPGDNLGSINNYSYLRHEFEQAKLKRKNIIIFYNSLIKQESWLPSYMQEYKSEAQPFWIKNENNDRIGNYEFLKQKLGY